MELWSFCVLLRGEQGERAAHSSYRTAGFDSAAGSAGRGDNVAFLMSIGQYEEEVQPLRSRGLEPWLPCAASESLDRATPCSHSTSNNHEALRNNTCHIPDKKQSLLPRCSPIVIAYLPCSYPKSNSAGPPSATRGTRRARTGNRNRGCQPRWKDCWFSTGRRPARRAPCHFVTFLSPCRQGQPVLPVSHRWGARN